jgi:hypothetical protein
MLIETRVEPSIQTLDLTESGVEKLTLFAKDKQHEYVNNTPFPHIVIDNLFPNQLLEDVLQDIQGLDYYIAKNFYGSVKKFAMPDPWLMGPTARRLLLDLNSFRFCSFLENLTGISGIIPDPYLEGGGVHEICTGGFLKMHTDFNWHKKLMLDRRINMLIYLNKDWNEAWGGHLELWDSEMGKQCIKVSPLFNRTVIFSTSDFSYHGHPDPLQSPEEISRRSLALYYYSNGRPPEEVKFVRNTTTNYQVRPGEKFNSGNSPITLKKLVKKLVPPVLTDIYSYLRR